MLIVRSEEAKDRLVPLMDEGNQATTRSAPVNAILAGEFFSGQALRALLVVNIGRPGPDA